MLQNRKLLFEYQSTTGENTYGYADQYWCETELYLPSILAHTYNIIIDCGVGSIGHGREIVDGLNDTDKWFI